MSTSNPKSAKGTDQTDRVTLDPAELDDLAEVMRHVHHRHRVIGAKLQALTPGLQLATRVAPDETGSRLLTEKLTAAVQALGPIASAALSDMQLLQRTAGLARKADDAPKHPLTKAEAARLVDRVTGKSPEELAVLEASLVGGIGKAKDAFTDPFGKGKEKDEKKDTAVKDVLALAKKQLGTDEKGDNQTKYGTWFGMDGQPWCAMFVSWVFAKAGHELPALQTDKGFAGVAAGAEALKERHQLHDTPKVGSIWLHQGPTVQQDHTGIVTAVHDDGSFTTIEGNAGDSVVERKHSAAEAKSAYGFGWVL